MTPAPRTNLLAQLLVWMLIGVAVSLFLQWTQARALGGWSEMVPVGAAAPLRPVIESELGSLSSAWSQSHDGQYSFAIALDPFATSDVHSVFDSDGYRYRRILYPLLAGGFGTLGGNGVLAGLVIVAALGLGLGAAAAFDLTVTLGAKRWAVFGVLANPGLWLSVRMFTVDALGMGLALTGVALWMRKKNPAALVMFAAAILTKEQYVLVPLALAAWSWFEGRKMTAAITGIVPVLPLLAWSIFLTSRMSDAFAARGNLALLGVLDSSRVWRATSSLDQALIVVTLVGLLGGCAVLIRSTSLLRWLMLPWILLALVSSTWVWDLGNNAARVFAPLWVLDIVALTMPRGRRPSRSQGPPSA